MDKVYFITDGEFIKIGYTSGSIKKRIQQLQTGCAKKIYEVGYIEGSKEKEEELHKIFGNYRMQGTEWFIADRSLVEYINENNLNKNIYLFKENNKIFPCQSIELCE